MSFRNAEPEANSSRRSQDDIESWLVARFAAFAELDQDDVDVDRPFQEYRLDSSVAATLTLELAQWVGAELPVTLFWEHPTIHKLSVALASLEVSTQ